MIVHAVLFDINEWDIVNSFEWLLKHKIYPIKLPHLTKNKIRYRIKKPSIFKRFTSKKLNNGITLVLGEK